MSEIAIEDKCYHCGGAGVSSIFGKCDDYCFHCKGSGRKKEEEHTQMSYFAILRCVFIGLKYKRN